MKRAVYATIIGSIMASGMSSYASAAAWESVPSSWKTQRYQNMRPAFGPANDGLTTTGSIRREPSRPAIGQPRAARTGF